ncbi:SEC10/PgrA surface exclusion domain-containing protein [Streptococcus suis]
MKNKALKTLTLTTVAATALVTQQAYADEVVEVATSSSSNTANVEVSSSVTAEQVAAAKAAADAAANPVAYQQDSLVSAEAAAKTAQTNLDQAEQALTSAQDLATNATEETIAAAEKAIVSAEQTVVEAQNQVTSAEQATAIAQEQVDKAQAEANKAKTDADLAKSQADTSKAELEALQNSQEGRAISQAQAELKTAQEDVANKTTAVTTAKQNLEQAQAADTKLETDRASANAVLAEQKPKVKAAQDLVTEKEVDLETAKQNLVVANEKVEAVKPKATYKFSINLPDYLRDAYANLVKTDFSKDSIDAAIQAEKRYYGDIKAVDEIDKLSYATIESTDPTLYDVENLDIEQLLLLNQFAIDYTNAYRQVLGIDKKIVGNEWLIQVADVRARLYEEKYPEGFYGHDLEIIGAANDEVFGEASSMASNHEILAYPKFSSSGGLYEQNTKYYTMSEILHVIAQGINSFMLNDSGSAYGHFGSLMTYETMGFDLCFTYDYFEEYRSGVGNFVVVGAGKRTTEEYKNWDIFEETDSEITLGDPKTKYIGLEGEVLYGWSVNLSKKSYEIYNRLVERNISSQDYSAYESALKDQNAAQSSYNNVQAEYEKVAKELAKAQNDLSSAQSTYNVLVNTALQTPEAKKALELAQTDLASAQEVLVTAQNQWQAAEVKAKALTTEIAKAQADYDKLLATATTLKAQADDRKAEVATAQSVLTQAQNKLTEARQAVERAEQGVALAKTNLSTLKEAQVTLAKAQAAYAVAQKNAQAANQSLSETRAKLADLKLVYEKAYAEYLDLKKLYDLQTMVTPQPTVDSDNSKENLEQGDSSQNNVKTSSNAKVKLATNKLATNKDLSKTALNEISIAAATTEHKFAKVQTLPTTGEKETSLLSLLGLTALATGLGLAARRRQNG